MLPNRLKRDTYGCLFFYETAFKKLERRETLFLFTSLLSMVAFLFFLLKKFKVRTQPYTILSFSGAAVCSMVAVEVIHLLTLEWKALFCLVASYWITWFSFSLFKKIGTEKPAKILLYSMLPTCYIFVYTFVHHVVFLFPLCLMSIFAYCLTPKPIREQRKNLFVKE